MAIAIAVIASARNDSHKCYLYLLFGLNISKFLLKYSSALILISVTQCQRAVQAAEKNGDRAPTCAKSGKFERKQCDDKICWCVKALKGKPAFKNQKVPLNHPYDCKSE